MASGIVKQLQKLYFFYLCDIRVIRVIDFWRRKQGFRRLKDVFLQTMSLGCVWKWIPCLKVDALVYVRCQGQGRLLIPYLVYMVACLLLREAEHTVSLRHTWCRVMLGVDSF